MKIVDKTREEQWKKDIISKTFELAEELFGRVERRIPCNGGFYVPGRTASDLSKINFSSVNLRLEVRDESYFEKAKEFAIRYENMTNIEEEVTIETDYSK